MPMEKLIELLNEYDSSRTYKRNKDKGWRLGRYGELLHGDTWLVNAKLQCISKSYGFIEWLVNNNKIDHKKFEDSIQRYYDLEDYYLTEQVLMFLSIQDSPIDFLISILK